MPVQFDSQFQNGTGSSLHGHNSLVSKILPATTFRTIDLEGTKNFRPFVFWILRETRDFFSTSPTLNFFPNREDRLASTAAA